jgi:hypothetical protein
MILVDRRPGSRGQVRSDATCLPQEGRCADGDRAGIADGDPAPGHSALREVGESPIGEAISYALNHWEALARPLEAGFLELDNGAAERAMKPVALGRKNWLFAGSDKGGETAAVLLSLCTTCKNLGIDPQAYLRDVLDRISTHPASRIEELLPDRWQALRQGGATVNA